MDIQITKTTKPRLADFDFSDIPFGKHVSDHMLVAEYGNGKWMDWRIVPYQAFPMEPKCVTIQYAQCIFEGMKATMGKDQIPVLFRPELNIRRFNLSAERMCMPTVPEDLFMEALKAIVSFEKGWIPQGKGKSLYVRPTMYATGNDLGVKPSHSYRFVIFTLPTDVYYSQPVKLVTENTYIRAVPGGTGEAKTGGNYAASLLPAQRAKQQGYDQVIWLEAPDYKKIQEVGTMNLFFVIDDKVITPRLSGAILRGTTRLTLMELLKDKDIVVAERDITIDEVMEAHHQQKLQEAFGVGTAAVVSHISEITHKGKRIVLPPVAERTIAPMLYHEIEGLRSGEITDKKDWLVPVAQMEYEH
ncbi:MAG: branched-chain amino acid aminotransferase [Flavobacteriaceae bacterium]